MGDDNERPEGSRETAFCREHKGKIAECFALHNPDAYGEGNVESPEEIRQAVAERHLKLQKEGWPSDDS